MANPKRKSKNFGSIVLFRHLSCRYVQFAFHLRFSQSYAVACCNFIDNILNIANFWSLLLGAQISINGTNVTVHKRNDLLLKPSSYNQKYSAKLSKGDHNIHIEAQRGGGSVASTHLQTDPRKLWAVNIKRGKQTQYLFTPFKTNRRPLYLKTQSVPLCKHFSSRL
jgi:hypothetical protein